MSTMTPQGIAQLSGRDLSMAVCEFYGWQWVTDKRGNSVFADPSLQKHLIREGATIGKTGTDEEPDLSCYEFADDTALAFQFADKVGLFDTDVYLHRKLDWLYRGWQWYVSKVSADDIQPIATGATRAEAVCRASLLLAMEGK